MQISLKDRVAWITGGSEGIGREIALLAADCGAKVAITGRDPEPLAETVKHIEQRGGDVISAQADVTKPDQMRAAVAQVMERWGRLDFVCANAGTNGTWAPVEELAPEDWSSTLEVNLTGTFLTIHVAVPHLKQTGGGSIVIVSSINGTRCFSNEGASAYAASKAGQLSLGKMLALELAPAKIRVNVICPGAMGTEIHEKTEKHHLEQIDNAAEYPEGAIPLIGGDMGDAQEAAKLAVFLASDASRFITGTPIWIDGGQSLLQG
jgi:NAD(P)-dependent dehydrogenase (short-subunit alcohol dehydrogenase family)